MAVAINTGTAVAIDRTQYGTHWAVRYVGGTLKFDVSTDGGATWVDSTDDITNAIGGGESLDFFIDVDDYAHVVFAASLGDVRYMRGTPNATRTRWTWSSPVALFNSPNLYDMRLVAHRVGPDWTVHVLFTEWTAGGAPVNLRLSRISVTAGGAFGVTSVGVLLSVASLVEWRQQIDFHHTGDGKTVQGSTPHVFIAYTYNGQLQAQKFVYSAGTWTPNTARIIDSGAGADRLAARFDGSAFVMAYNRSTALTATVVRERDAADTVTTTLAAPPALSDGNIENLGLTYDPSRNLYLYAVGTTSDDPKRVTFTRATATWGTWSALEATTVAADTMYVRRGTQGRRVDTAYVVSGAARFDSLYLNQTPTAPTWVTAGGTYDVAAALLLDWDHQDPDEGDTQAGYRVKRIIGATTRWWNGTDFSATTETDITSSTTSLSLASAWGADGDADHGYYVATKDTSNAWGPYSSVLTITPSAKVNPVVTGPAEGGSLTTSTTTVTWTAAQQTAYRVRILNGSNVELWTSGWVIDTATRSLAVPYVHANSSTFKAEVTTKNLEGLESNADTNTYSTTFTPPATPTLVAIENVPAGAITWDATNPVPSGGQPVLTYNDLYRREVGTTGDGIRIATDLADDASFIDWAVASGVEYEARVAAWGENGVVAYSAWVS